MINEMKNKKRIAISQIMILVLGIIAIGYALGSEIKVVDAAVGKTPAGGSGGTPFIGGTRVEGLEQVLIIQQMRNGVPYDKATEYASSEITKIIGSARPCGAAGTCVQSGAVSNIKWNDEADQMYKTEWKKNPNWFQDEVNAYKREVPQGLTNPCTASTIGFCTDANGNWIYQGTKVSDADTLEKKFASDADKPISPASQRQPIDSGTKKGEESKDVEGVWAGVGVGFLGNLVQGAMWGAAAYALTRTLAPIFGADTSQTRSLSLGVLGGIMVGKGTLGIMQQWGADLGFQGVASQYGTVISGGAGIVAGLMIYRQTYKKEERKIVTYSCFPEEAEMMGRNCELCNNQGDGIPCSEYQCKSLGQACELLNKGTAEEQCAWVNRNDVDFPTISPSEEALTAGYIYYPADKLFPQDRGVIILPQTERTNTECIAGKRGTDEECCFTPFSQLSFGINTNEPSKCKTDLIRKANFSQMDYPLGGSLFKYNHTETMNLPGLSTEGLTELSPEQNGDYEIYVRCTDSNGNIDTANFVFKFCVKHGPDTTPPLIEGTDLVNEMPVAFDVGTLKLNLYVNDEQDGVQCRWDHKDVSYELMQNKTGTCRLSNNPLVRYECPTTLGGIKNDGVNEFYFRCNDTYMSIDGKGEPNINKESFKFTVIGTKQLVISSANPNNTIIRDSVSPVKVPVKVTTFGGYKQGAAKCYIDRTNEILTFDKTGGSEHTMDLYLGAGTHTETIRCVDLGGNSDIVEITFDVEVDRASPEIVRVYHEQPYLKVITSEKAECVYSTSNTDRCTYLFADGIPMNAFDDKNHYADWDATKTFYIKCKDAYNQEPKADECSPNGIIKPFEESGKEL